VWALSRLTAKEPARHESPGKEWTGNYEYGKRLEFAPDEDASPFTHVYPGYWFVIFGKADGSLYGQGEKVYLVDSQTSNALWQWPDFPVYLGASLKDAGWLGNDKSNLSPYYLTADGDFIRRDTREMIAANVKDVYQYDDSSFWWYNRTLLLKTDDSLWWCRLDGSANQSFIDEQDLSKPVKIMDDVATAAAGGSLAYFVIKTDGSLWMFDGNFNGEAGNGTLEPWDSATFDELNSVIGTPPSKVMDNVAKVSYGNGQVLALTTDGIAYAWGINDYGQAGVADLSPVLTPVKLADNVADIGAAGETSYILKKDGTLWGCGRAWNEGPAGTFDSNPVLTQITDVYRFLDGKVN